MKLSIAEFTIKLVLVFGWLNFTVHEYSHLLMARVLGHYGEIRSTGLNLMYPSFAYAPPQWQIWLIYGAGGMGVFITFMILTWRNKCPASSENNTSYRLIAIMNLIYAVFEALFPSTFWGIGGLIGMMTAVTYFMYLLFVKKAELTLW